MNLIQKEIKKELERFIILIGSEIISTSNNAKEYEQTEKIKKSLNELLEKFEEFDFNSNFPICSLRLKVTKNFKF